MRSILLLALWLLAAGAAPAAETLVFVGTQGRAIVVARLDERTGALSGGAAAAEVERPTWVEADAARGRLFAVSEAGERGEVLSFATDRRAGALRPIARVPSPGGPTHLATSRRGDTVFVAHYGTGHVAAVPVRRDGALAPGASVVADAGSGPHRRQTGPHAHAAVPDPSGRYLLVPDLGADRVFVYRFAAGKLSPAAAPFVPLPPGSGPRHLAFSPDGRFAYLVTELTAELRSYRWDARGGQLRAISVVPLDPAEFAGTRSGAEVRVSADGRFVYLSNRGRNLLQVFAAREGVLAPVQEIASGGATPWSFALTPSGCWLVVANQGAGEVRAFAVDRATGRLGATDAVLSVAKPTSVAFVPAARM